MTDFANLGATFTTTGGGEFIATVEKAGSASTTAAATTDKLNAAQQRHAKALRDYSAAIKANAAANVAANQAAAVGMQRLVQAETAIRTSLAGTIPVHTKAAAAAKLHGHELLNLSRQFSDIGVTAAMGMNPLMILIQQGPQIAETMAQAAARGVTLKAALADLALGARALWASFAPLLVTMLPFIALFAAIAAGAWLVFKRYQDMKAKNEELSASANKLRDALGKIDPALNAQAQASDLAAEGARNFANWIEEGNKKLGTYAEQLKTATVNQLMFNAAQAAGLATQYRENNTRRTARGVVLKFGVNAKEYAAEQARLDALSADSDALAKKGLNAPLAAFTEPARKAAKGADEAAQALKRLKEQLADLQHDADNPDPALRKITDNIALLDKAAKAGLISGAAYSALFMKLKEQAPAVAKLKEATKFTFADIEKKLPDVDLMWRTTIERRIVETTEAAESFGDAISDTFNAIRSKNWGAAFAGLFTTLKKLKAEWSSMSKEGKIGAVAGIADSVGQAVGGTLGSGISGAASGAMAGTMMFGPGIGTAIGALVGGIGGLLSGSKAKKQAKAEAERQRLADEAARALEVENQAREINVQRLLAEGKTLEAQQVQRDYQLAQTAEANRAALVDLWALQDAQEALNKANAEATAAAEAALAFANQQRDLEIRLMDAQGLSAQALARTREIEMEATNALLRPVLQSIYDQEDANQRAKDAADALKAANDELSTARDREAGVIQGTLDKLRDARTAMLAFRDAITPVGGTAAAGTALEAFKAAALQAANDNGASFDKQQAASEAYLEVSKNTATTQLEELRATAKVREALDKTLEANGKQITVAQAQLDALNATVDAVLQVNSSVKTVAMLLAARNGGAAATPGGGSSGSNYYDSASDSWKASASSADAQRLMAGVDTFQDPTGAHYGDSGYATLLLDQFNSGGFDHLRDANGDPTGVLAQIMGAGFQRLTDVIVQGNAYNKATADTLDRVTAGGDAMAIAS